MELYKRKLITIDDTTLIQEKTMILPMTIEQFINYLGRVLSQTKNNMNFRK